MDFFELRPSSRADTGRPKVRTVNKNVLLSIPMALAEHLGLDTAKAVRVQFGQDEISAAIRLRPDEAGSWLVKRRKSLLQVYVPEILPKAEVAEQEVDFSDADGVLTLSLPSPWLLSNSHVVRRQASRRTARS